MPYKNGINNELRNYSAKKMNREKLNKNDIFFFLCE